MIDCFHELFCVGNHTFAVVKGSESYELLSGSLHCVFKELNGIIELGSVAINGQNIKLDFVLGSDYKVHHSMLYM